MKALSLWQPHASLITTGAKPFETRHWTTKVRGDILIHAALTKKDMDLVARPDVREALLPLFTFEEKRDVEEFSEDSLRGSLPFGALVGIAYVGVPIQTHLMTEEDIERSNGFGDFTAGRFAWPLWDVRRFAEPIPWKGRQGFFDVDIDLSQHLVFRVT